MKVIRFPDLKGAHAHSRNNRDEVSQSEWVGCFFCLRIFSPRHIQKWLYYPLQGEAQDCVCPYCEVDSLIGDKSGYPINQAFLRRMEKKWFGDAVKGVGS